MAKKKKKNPESKIHKSTKYNQTKPIKPRIQQTTITKMKPKRRKSRKGNMKSMKPRSEKD